MSASYWIKKLKLKPHPEGGWYRETYRSRFSTAIYYLLEKRHRSRLHRIQSDEIWHFYAGDPLVVWGVGAGNKEHGFLLGKEDFQAVIPAGTWFGAYLPGESQYVLVGCTVAPAFEFRHFELARREQLLNKFPRHQQMILKLT